MKTQDTVFTISDILRAVARTMETPVVVVLILLMAAAVFMLGWLIAEALGERRKLTAALPALIEKLRESPGDREMAAAIEGAGLLRRQKAALLELLAHPEFTPVMREALAAQLLETEEARWNRTVLWTDLIARLGPMFGLLGTLIPLGPGIIALGQGDTFTLSQSLLTAFDTTVAGLLAAALASVISAVRKRWYRRYATDLETLAECILELVKQKKEEASCCAAV